MRWMLIVAVLVGGDPCSCEPSADTKARAAELSSGYKQHADVITAKQDQTLATLTEVKSRVGDLLLAADDTKQRLETLEASLVKSNPNGKESDPASALEPQEPTRPNLSQPIKPVASAPAVRLQFFTQEKCAPCKPQKTNAEAAAAELGIELEVFDLADGSGPFERSGISNTPATIIVIDDTIRVRFVSIVSSAGIVARVKKELEATTAQPVGSFPAYPKDSAIVGERLVLRPDNRAGRRNRGPVNSAFRWTYSAAGSGW